MVLTMCQALGTLFVCIHIIFATIYKVLTIFFFWPCLWHVELPGPGIESEPQQYPKPQQ